MAWDGMEIQDLGRATGDGRQMDTPTAVVPVLLRALLLPPS